MGVVFTLKRRLDQCYQTILAHPEGLSGAIDGMFGFHNRRWVFLNIGATSTHLDTKKNKYATQKAKNLLAKNRRCKDAKKIRRKKDEITIFISHCTYASFLLQKL